MSIEVGATPITILIEATNDDWTQFLKRTMLNVRGSDDTERLHRLLKYGLDVNYWNAIVFRAYHYHHSDAIFLAGIPDLTATPPMRSRAAVPTNAKRRSDSRSHQGALVPFAEGSARVRRAGTSPGFRTTVLPRLKLPLRLYLP